MMIRCPWLPDRHKDAAQKMQHVVLIVQPGQGTASKNRTQDLKSQIHRCAQTPVNPFELASLAVVHVNAAWEVRYQDFWSSQDGLVPYQFGMGYRGRVRPLRNQAKKTPSRAGQKIKLKLACVKLEESKVRGNYGQEDPVN